MSHLEHHNPHIICSMFFYRFKSCELQLIEFVSDIVNNSRAKQTDVIILDFSKTFNYVPHNRLLYKLENYEQSIRGDTLKRIKAFLENWQQSVVVDDERCDFVAVLSCIVCLEAQS